MEIIKLENKKFLPENYTGKVEYSDGSESWYKEGKLHRLDGLAVEHKINRDGFWYIDGNRCFDKSDYCFYKKYGVFIDIEVREYGIEWIRFMTEEEIEEFPIHPKMEGYEEMKKLISLL